MAVRFPQVPFARALGVGFDMRYGDVHGLVRADAPGPVSDVMAPRVRAFLDRERAHFGYAFFSFQPKDRGLLEPADYFPIWDRMLADCPDFGAFALHHTQLNLASIDERVDRRRLLAFTNALIDRYDLRWVNEDVGIWSIDGKMMPYPLPPILTRAGLEAAIRHVSEVTDGLCAPLVLEFPGFSEGTNFFIGTMDAYDFFRELAERTGSPVTLDTGHLLSFRWLRGHRGAALYEELERLPLDHCFEVHLSGCQIARDRFVDVHNGVIAPQQLEMLARLLPLCPNLRAVTYEDPKLSPDGMLPDKARAPFASLAAMARAWCQAAGGGVDVGIVG